MIEKIRCYLVLRSDDNAKKITFIINANNQNSLIKVFKSLKLAEKHILKKIPTQKLEKILCSLTEQELYAIFKNNKDIIFDISPSIIGKIMSNMTSVNFLKFIDRNNSFSSKLWVQLRQEKAILNSIFKKLTPEEKIIYLKNYRIELSDYDKEEFINYFMKNNNILLSDDLIEIYKQSFDCISVGLNIDVYSKLFNKDFFKNFKKSTNLEPHLLLKYFVYDNMLNQIIYQISDNPSLFNKILITLFNDYSNLSLSQKFQSLTKTTQFINNYPQLCKDIHNQERSLNDIENYSLMFLVNEKPIVGIHSVEQLKLVISVIEQKIKEMCNKETNIQKLKQLYIEICYNKIFNNEGLHINKDSLNRIFNKHIDDVTDLKITQLLQIMDKIQQINNIKDIDIIKEQLRNLDFNKLLLDYLYSQNLFENLRTIYKNDTVNSLTNVRQLPSSLIRKDEKTGVLYYDLSECEYGLLVHHSNVLPQKLVEPDFKGYTHISLTPIGNKGKNIYKYVKNGIIYGYSEIPSDRFIFNSTKNSDSNLVGENNYEYTENENVTYYPEEFEMTCFQSLDKETPETNVFRDGLIPSCIVLSQDTPTLQEIEAQKQLSKYLGYNIPLIKTQPNLSRIEHLKMTKREIAKEFLIEEKAKLSAEILNQIHQNNFNGVSILNEGAKQK